MDYPEAMPKPQTQQAEQTLDLNKFDSETRAKIEDLLQRRKTLINYTRSIESGITGSSDAKDAANIAKIDAQLAELGITPGGSSAKNAG